MCFLPPQWGSFFTPCLEARSGRVWSLVAAGIRRRRHGAMPCILTEYAKGVDAGRGAGVAAGHSLEFRSAEEAWFTLLVAICLSRHGSAPFSELCGSQVHVSR